MKIDRTTLYTVGLHCAIIARGFAILMASLWLAQCIKEWLDLIIPANVLGLLLLFLLLITKIVPIDWVRPTSQFILQRLILLFIPITIGILKYWPTISQSILAILATVLLSSVTILICVSVAISLIIKEDKS